ncbi:hypothetical protein MMAGJ_00060 [Mycolicibacterium mageritense]|uniref:Uncharacterized protein n=1 Tax=Mycolicibacterium mageritense TaxID=53462 RepID=A0ABM7HJQ7_MYCME|nr:hypothetical protein MMAGJ_00060 [Mycolicibacterium mageritense]
MEGAEDTPVTMSEGGESAPVTMSTGTPEAPVTMTDPISDTNVGTETSADTTIPPTAESGHRAAHSTDSGDWRAADADRRQQPNAAYGPGGGAPGQLSQPQASRGGAPQSPEKKREAQDRRTSVTRLWTLEQVLLVPPLRESLAQGSRPHRRPTRLARRVLRPLRGHPRLPTPRPQVVA